ncbi:MAG: alanine racemase [Actinomycetota bacterium]
MTPVDTPAVVSTGFRPTVAEIDLDAVRHNVRTVKPADAELMAVVKANGYGHRAIPIARAALQGGATWLGVALVEEGLALRESGIDAPILVLTELPPGSEREAVEAGLTPTLYSERALRELAAAAPAEGVGVHVKVDTGMHRVGIPPQEAPELASDVLAAGLRIDGVWTHFARAEEPGNPTTARQLELFLEVCAALEARGIRPRYRHAANSGATMAAPETHLDLVRVGAAMYGIAPGPDLAGVLNLRPAMTLRSAVTHSKRVPSGHGISYGHRFRTERETTIATVPIGYADGYLRSLSNAGHVLIRGTRYPVVGSVTMDHLMVDCGDEPVEVGDDVVLFGRQGQSEIRVEEVAAWAGTIGWEIVCAVSERVPRRVTVD